MSNTYVNILIDSLRKKISLLDEIQKITLIQENLISSLPVDMYKIDQTITDKSVLIEKLNMLDSGFEQIYALVKDELNIDRLNHKEDIIALQDLIRIITDKSTDLKATEFRNRNRLEIIFANQKKEINKFKANSRAVSNYYKNMSGQLHEESFFLDKKK